MEPVTGREHPVTGRERFTRALSCRPVDRPPVWVMRQAGRYLPEYRELRGAHEFLECLHRPELAAELTLQPLRRFPFDAGILFCDILVVLEAMGLRVDFPHGGPTVWPSMHDLDLSRLRTPVAERDFAFVTDAIGAIREGIAKDERIGGDRALLGFAGAPFTLACYAIEGRGSTKEFADVRALMRKEPAAFDELLARIAETVAELLVLQLRAGVDAVQLFDTWGGLLDGHEWRTRVQPHVERIVDRVHAEGGRCIVFVKDTAHLVDAILETGCDAIGVDWRTDIGWVSARAAERAGAPAAVQGNVDPTILFAPPDTIRAAVHRARRAVDGRTGHVLNLGHGVLPPTPIAGMSAFLDAAMEPLP